MEASGRGVERNMAIVVLANIALAGTALVRESRLAAFVGTTEAADAFLLALYLVDLAANLVMAGTITFAAIPVLSRYLAAGNCEGFRRTLAAAVGLVGAVTLALSVAGWSAGPLVIGRVGAGLARETRDLARVLFGYLLPSVPFFGLAAMFSSALYALERFATPSFGPVALNLAFLLGLALAPTLGGLRTLAISFTLGTGVAFLMQMLAMARTGFLRAPTARWRDPGLQTILRRSWPAMAAILLMQPGGLVEKLLASTLGQGGIAGLGYAYKLSQFPVWVFSAAIGTVLFPRLAAAVGERDTARFRAMLIQGLSLTMFVCLPFTVIFVLLAAPMVSLIFQYGAFDSGSLHITSGVLRTYALGIGAQGAAYLFVRALYSLGDTAAALRAAAVSAVVTVASDVVLVHRWGLAGLGLGASVGAVAYVAVLGRVVSKRIGSVVRDLAPFAWRALLATSALGLVTYVFGKSLLCDLGQLEAAARTARVGLALASGALVYLGLCYALRLPGLPALVPWSGRASAAPTVPWGARGAARGAPR